MQSRRKFIKKSALSATLISLDGGVSLGSCNIPEKTHITITRNKRRRFKRL